MKTLSLALALLATSLAHADHDHDHVAARHGMVIFGTGPIYASHIVYKVPHNYQVILEVSLDEATRARYLVERAAHPDDLFVLLLDSFDISNIANEESVSGVFFREDAAGNRVDLLPSVTLPRAAYKILYFDEVPMSPGSPAHSSRDIAS